MPFPFHQFELYIDETILKRGLSYFKNGSVENVEEVSHNRFEAIVQGTDAYLVKIQLEKDQITQYSCNCPYDQGPVCKHVAALLFHLVQDELGIEAKTPKGGKAEKKPAKRKTKEEQVSELLDKLDIDELRNFIREQATESRLFRDTFFVRYAHLDPLQANIKYASLVSNIIRSRSNRDGFIDWSAANIVGIELGRLLDSAINHLRNGNHLTAFHIATAVLEKTFQSFEYSDDSDGSLGSVLDQAIVILDQLAEESNTEILRGQLFNYSLKSAEKGIYKGWDWHTQLFYIALAAMDGEKEALQILEIIDHDPVSDYDIEEMQMLRYKVLLKGMGEGKAETYLETHPENSYFREYFLSHAMVHADYDKARNIALESVRLYENTKPGLASHWYEHLLEIAQAANDTERIIEYAHSLFLGRNGRPEHFFNVLRQHIDPDKWVEFRTNLIREIGQQGRFHGIDLISRIYVWEEMWPELMEVVRQTGNLSTVAGFEPYLAADYAPELAEIYEKGILRQLVPVTNRKQYQWVCGYIRRIADLGEREKAKNLIEELRVKYPTRKALLDELNKVRAGI